MVGQKLSIVTDKPQTTRHRILGICSEPEYQVSEFNSVQYKLRSSEVSGPITIKGIMLLFTANLSYHLVCRLYFMTLLVLLKGRCISWTV
jgi:hypothetical protein